MISLTEFIDEKKYTDTAKNRSLGRVGKDWGVDTGTDDKKPKEKRFQ